MLTAPLFAAFLAAPVVIPDALPAGATARLGTSRYVTRGTIGKLVPAGDLVVGASADDGPMAWDSEGRTRLRHGCNATATFFCRTTATSTLAATKSHVSYAVEGRIRHYRLPDLRMKTEGAGYFMDCAREWFTPRHLQCLRRDEESGKLELKSIEVMTSKERVGPFRGFALGRDRRLQVGDPEMDMDDGTLLDGRGRVIRKLGNARQWIFEPGVPRLAAAQEGKDERWQFIDVFDVRTGKRQARHPAPKGVQYARAAIGKSGRVAIAFAHKDKKDAVHIAVVPADFPPVQVPGRNVYSITVTPSGAVWAAVDHRLHHVDPTGRLVDPRPRLGKPVMQLHFTDRGLLAAAGDGIIHWGLDGKPLWALEDETGLVTLSSTWAIAGDRLVRVSDGNIGRSPCKDRQYTNSARPTDLAFDPAGRLVCPDEPKTGTLRLITLDPRTGAEQGRAVVANNDPTYVTATHIWQARFEGLFAIDRKTGKTIGPVPKGKMHLGRDGQVYTLDRAGIARMVIKDGAIVQVPLARRQFTVVREAWRGNIDVTAFAIRPGKPHAVLGWSDGHIEVVHLETGKTLFTSKPVSREIASVAASPDGTWFATGGWFGQSYLWRFDDVLGAP